MQTNQEYIIQYIYNMKNINSKSFKQYQPNAHSGNKRSVSPLLASANQIATIGSSNNHGNTGSNSNPKSAKKKIITNSPYQRAVKQFQSYGKGERKKITNLNMGSGMALALAMHDNDSNNVNSYSKQQHNKFRIVTEPVDDRIMHLAQSNIFSSSLAIGRGNTNANGGSTTQIRVNLRGQPSSHSKSRQRIHTGHYNYNNLQTEQSAEKDRHEQRNNISNNNTSITKKRKQSANKDRNSEKDREKDKYSDRSGCKNCIKYAEQLEYLSVQVRKIIRTKQLWDVGEIGYEEAQQVLRNGTGSVSGYGTNQYDMNTLTKGQKGSNHNSLQNIQKNHYHSPYKFADSMLGQLKKTLSNLISQLQSLSQIDYPKMLQMQVFKYEPNYPEYLDHSQTQLQELFTQLRGTIQGRVVEYDQYDYESQNKYTGMIMRNLKNRLNGVLRQNLQLRVMKAIYQRSQQIAEESEEYLRKVVEEVIECYVQKGTDNRSKQSKDRQKQKEKDKQRDREKGKLKR